MTRCVYRLLVGLFCLTAPLSVALADVVDSQSPDQVAQADGAQPAGGQDAPLPPIENVQAPAPQRQPNQPGASNHTARLDENGNLNGRLSLIDPATGNLTPANNVVVSFIRNGELITQTRPRADGTFTATGLQPGVYSVVASGPGGFSAFSASVLPNVPGMEPGQLQLDGTLIPEADFAAMGSLLPPALGPPPFGGPGAPFGGGGGGGPMGGGGGGGLAGAGAGLLGLAGLAGLASLDDDDEREFASPDAP